MSIERRRSLLALALALGSGSRTLATLLAAFPDPETIWEESGFSAAFRARLPQRRLACLDDPAACLAAADAVLESCARLGIEILDIDGASYPPLLAAIYDPPRILYVRGDPAALATPCLSLVGTRRPTPAGLQLAWECARQAARAGWTVVSGGASGIDGAAHQGALDGGGRTLMVLAHGLDYLYPAEHRDLAEKAVACGALLSEYPPGVLPRPGYFARRNRIISGLSRTLFVIQAPLGSGALITASCALDQGRDVLVGDWPEGLPQGAGCRALAEEGAGLLDAAAGLFAKGEEGAGEPLPEGLSGDLAAVYRHLGAEGLPVSALAERLGLGDREAAVLLMRLELLGLARSWEGGVYTRALRKTLSALPPR